MATSTLTVNHTSQVDINIKKLTIKIKKYLGQLNEIHENEIPLWLPLVAMLSWCGSLQHTNRTLRSEWTEPVDV